ncbi:MAG: hypothetical protein NTY95_17445, partial [Bacteroidia bacterium]|nr:hypothetical protein [Bacteroidia bacterium]
NIINPLIYKIMTEIVFLLLGRNVDAVQKLIIVVMLALLCMITYLIILNIKTLHRVLKQQPNEKKSRIDDERYYELNSKIQLLIVVSSIIILIGGFLGYNSIDSIKGDIQNRMNEYVTKLEGYDSIIYRYNGLLSTLESERDTTFNSLLITKFASEKTKNDLAQLQNEYRLNAKTYFAKGIKISPELLADNSKTARILFNDLKSFNINIPQAFREEPFVTVVGIGDGIITIKNIRKEYFEYSFSGYTQLGDGLLSILDSIKIDANNKDEMELYNHLKSLLKKGFKKDRPDKNYTEATTFDLIIIEGLSN